MENRELGVAKKLCFKIENLGFEALLVGGCVRDILLDLEPNDIDAATNCPMDKLEKHFKTFDIGKSKDFGIVVVVVDGVSLEVAQYRGDGAYTDGRHPDSVVFKPSFEEDALRRDFTINALAMRHDGEILDFTDGRTDMKNRILRTVGDPKDRFSEDKLRILRLARFAAKLDFTIDPETRRTARKMAKDVKCLATERITDELKKAAKLGGVKFAKYIAILDDLKVLKEILPEVAALKYMPETHGWHPEGCNTLEHTMKALESASSASSLELIAILFHDIGKAVTHSIDGCTSRHRYHNHDNAGSCLVKNLSLRMKFSTKERDMLEFTTKNHMRFHRIPEMKKAKIVKLAKNANFKELSVVCFADSLRNTRSIRNTGVMEVVEKAMENHKDTKLESLVSGELIMELLDLKPGKEVGRIKKLVTEYVMNNNLTDLDDIGNAILTFGKGEIK